MGIIGLLLTVVSTAAQISSQRKAAKAQREARAISTASQDISDRLSRRKLAREERIRRARLLAGAEANGGIGSSSFLGAQSALSANTDSAIAEQSGQSIAAKGISAANQRAADAETKYNQWTAFQGLIQSGTQLYKTYNS